MRAAAEALVGAGAGGRAAVAACGGSVATSTSTAGATATVTLLGSDVTGKDGIGSAAAAGYAAGSEGKAVGGGGGTPPLTPGTPAAGGRHATPVSVRQLFLQPWRSPD